jgi:hypothetical protein
MHVHGYRGGLQSGQGRSCRTDTCEEALCYRPPLRRSVREIVRRKSFAIGS